MKKAIGYGTLIVILATILTAGAAAPPNSQAASGPAPTATPEKVEHGALHILLLYLPNRVLDILDVARLRARVGPGMAADVRVTKAGDLFLGTYASVDGGIGPDNGACEAGLGVQLLIVGVDAGVDPLELLDAVLGLLTIDLRGDDL